MYMIHITSACDYLGAVLLIVAAPFLGKSKTRNPNTLGALKWRAEFDVGEFGACQMYFNALSVWLQPGDTESRRFNIDQL